MGRNGATIDRPGEDEDESKTALVHLMCSTCATGSSKTQTICWFWQKAGCSSSSGPLYFAYKGAVYDATFLLTEGHPGGTTCLRKYHGTDIACHIDEFHSGKAKRMLFAHHMYDLVPCRMWTGKETSRCTIC